MTKRWQMECNHEGLINVAKEQVTDGEFSSSYVVTLCPKCGLFTVSTADTQRVVQISFSLVTKMELDAAGMWIKNAAKAQQEEFIHGRRM